MEDEPVSLDQSTPEVPGAAETGDDFGADVSVGDIDGDGTRASPSASPAKT